MLRPAGEGDAETIRGWRNQAANREVSLHQHEIGAAEHRRWWSEVVGDPARRVLVLELEGTPCGVVTFTGLRDVGHQRYGRWGFHLDHDGLGRRGATLVAWQQVMRAAVTYAFELLALDVLEAEVLEHNAAVRSANRRLGFHEGPVRVERVDGEERRVLPLRLDRATWQERARRRAASRPAAVGA